MSTAVLKMISSMATRAVLSELAAQYQSTTGKSVVAEAAGGVDVAKRVRAGEQVDIVVLASDVIDKLLMEGKLQAGSRMDLVKSGIAIAVREGQSKPDVMTEAAVKHAVMAAPSLSYSTGPSGDYLKRMFERWGILEAIRERIVVPPPGVPVGSQVAEGKAALGFQQLSELINCPGVTVVGPLPDSIQMLTIFSAGISMATTQAEAARAFLNYMVTPAAAPIKQRHGMEPA